MDPSHARRYTKAGIERIVSEILADAFPKGIRIPIDIDRLAQRHELVDDIASAELLEDQFKVAALLISKPNGHFDIFVDEDTFNSYRARANFSIAHELGHIVLHSQICSNCQSIEESISLSRRIKHAYHFIEGNANYFAGAILIPRRTLLGDTATLYEGLVKLYGYDVNLIPSKLCSRLAERYCVNLQPMEIRLKGLHLQRKIVSALRTNSPYLDP